MNTLTRNILFSSLVFFGLLEIGLRFFLGNFAQSALVEIIDDPNLCLILGKNKDLEYTGWWGKVDASNMSSNRFGSREPRNTIDSKHPKFFMLGDSFTYGQGVDVEHSIPYQLQETFPLVDLWNYGVPGRDFYQFQAEMQRLLSQKPTWIAINIFANDFDLPPKHCMVSKNASLLFPLMRHCYSCRLALFQLVLSSPPTERPKAEQIQTIRAQIQQMQALAQQEQVQLIFTFLTDRSSMKHGKTELPNIRQILREEKATIIDLAYAWTFLSSQPEKYILPKEYHLNEEGNRVLSVEYAKQLQMLFAEQGIRNLP